MGNIKMTKKDAMCCSILFESGCVVLISMRVSSNYSETPSTEMLPKEEFDAES